jgi:hypothetical protein
MGFLGFQWVAVKVQGLGNRMENHRVIIEQDENDRLKTIDL